MCLGTHFQVRRTHKLWASGVTGRGGSAPVSAPLAPAWATQAKGFASHSRCLRKRAKTYLVKFDQTFIPARRRSGLRPSIAPRGASPRPLCSSRRRTRSTGSLGRSPNSVVVAQCSSMGPIAPQWESAPVPPNRCPNVNRTAVRPARRPSTQVVLRKRRQAHPQRTHRQWKQRRRHRKLPSGGSTTRS